MQPLIGQTPGDRLAGPQLLATYRARFPANPGLNVGKRSGSAPRRSHGSLDEQPRCQWPSITTTQSRCQASALHLDRHMADVREAPKPDRWQRMLDGVRHKRRPFTSRLELLSSRVTTWAGSSSAFAIALLVVLTWVITGPLFHFSDTWQLVINTGTTIVTFLMVFLIQRSQNKDAVALHLKLNEIVAALQGASNRLINVEDLSESEVRLLHRHYGRLAELSREDNSLTESHSIEQAVTRHASKHKHPRPASVSGSMS